MQPVSIAVASLFPDIFAVCKESVDRFESGLRKLLVIDADPKFASQVVGVHDTSGWESIRVEMPYIGSRLGNITNAALYPDDVFGLGDDVQLTRPVIARLQEIAYSDSSIGIVAPRVYGACGNAIQNAQGKNFHGEWVESKERLAFIAVYIKREVLDRIGPMDLRFTGYGGDDTDYCIRTQQAGYKLAVALHLNVKHGIGKSSGTMTWSRLGPDLMASHVEMHLALEQKYKSLEGALS
jgi:hypothetical protein